MLTTLKNYEEFLIYYYNLCTSNPVVQDGVKFWSLEYIKFKHDLEVYPQIYAQGNYLVDDKLKECFLVWYRDKDKMQRKMEIH